MTWFEQRRAMKAELCARDKLPAGSDLEIPITESDAEIKPTTSDSSSQQSEVPSNSGSLHSVVQSNSGALRSGVQSERVSGNDREGQNKLSLDNKRYQIAVN